MIGSLLGPEHRWEEATYEFLDHGLKEGPTT